MKAIILAAGYATRLYPLTKNKPKPLLEVGGRPIVEHIMDKLGDLDVVDEVFVVTNNKFFTYFLEWKSGFESETKITIVNDKTMSNEDRLGSLGDIRYVVETMKVDDDIIVVAGDNLFEFSLKPMAELFASKQRSVVALYDVKDRELARHYGIVSVCENNIITNFEEKPIEPKSTLSSTGIYIYPKQVVEHLIAFTEQNDADKAGNFLEWLHKQEEIHCCIADEKWFDIGTIEQLEKARKEFKGVTR